MAARPPGSAIPPLSTKSALPEPAARGGRGGPGAPPSGPRRGLQARPPRSPARRSPTATQPAPLSGCTRPNPKTKTTKWLPAAPSRDPFVPFGPRNSAGPWYKRPGSAGGLRRGPAGPRRPEVEAGEGGVRARPATESAAKRRWRPFCVGMLLRRRRRRQQRERGLVVGRTGELTRTDSSSFSIPVGICGTARFIEAYSCRSGRSSQRKTGSGFEASSARARNDSLLISGAADTSPLWGNGPGQGDHGEPGVRSPLAYRCRGLEGRSAKPAVRALTPAGRVGGRAAPLLARSLSSIRHGQHGGH